ncbi:hypothetical protein KY285_027791 [Solanum tuberosum]|nr:hypothetical protein KY285_027791 [Solanum tuberosum]
MPPVVVEELSEEEQKELLLNPPSRENVLCLQCDNGRKFKSVKDLLEHFRVVHADLPQKNKKLFCNDCANLFRSPHHIVSVNIGNGIVSMVSQFLIVETTRLNLKYSRTTNFSHSPNC